VNAVNDVPVATGNTVVASEDVPLVINGGDFSFTDVEGDALVSVVISGLTLNGGTLTHSAGGTTVTNGMTVTAAELADLTFTSAANDSTNSSFTYTVNDAGLGVTSDTMNITVNAVNDVPVATGNTVIASEDVPLVIDGSDFSFTDTEGDALVSVTISGLTLNGGTLTHSAGGTTVTNGMTVTAAELVDLTFTSAANDSTNSSFTYTVNDAGLGITSDTMNITVNAVNDVPVATGNTVVASEDVPLIIGAGDFNFTDVEGDALVSVTISGLTLNGGTLTHSGGGTTVTNGITVTAAELADLTFTSAANDSTNSSFTYTVNDADLGVASGTMNITVNAVNDVPVATGNTVIATEDIPLVIGVGDFNFTDVEGDALVSVVISGLTLNGGTLTHSAGVTTVTNGMTVTAAELADLTFTSAANDSTNSSFTYTVNDAGLGAISGTMNITVIPDGGEASTTTISGSSLTPTTDETVTITVQAKDGGGTNLGTGGDNVTLTINPPCGTCSLGSVIDNGNGTYTAPLTNTGLGAVTVEGTIDGQAIPTGDVTATFSPGAADENTSTIAISLSPVTTDDTVTITVQAKDQFGNDLVVSGGAVSLSSTGTGAIGVISDNANGTYTATITNITAETVTISGTINGNIIATGNPTITFNPGIPTIAQTTISHSPSTVVANGVNTATVTVQTKDTQGNNLTTGGETIVITVTGSTVVSAVADNSDGTYTATVTNTVSENVDLGATMNGPTITATDAILFTPNIPTAAQTIITASLISITADDIATSIITVQLKDALDNNITTGTDTITLAQSGSATITAVTNNGDGTHTATIKSTVAEVVTINGTLNGDAITDTADVTFTPGAMVIANTFVTASPVEITADGVTESTVTTQLKDAYNNNVSTAGLTVLFSTTGGAIIGITTDNGNGTYSAKVTNTVAEAVTISATVSATATPNTAVINFIPGPVSAAHSTLTASPSVVTANGSDISLLTVKTYDVFGNEITTGGHTVVLIDGNDASISPVIDQLDGTYTFTISNSVVQSTVVNGSINGDAMTDNETINFVEGGPAEVAASDGHFISGVGPIGSTIEVQDADGNILCSNVATDPITGEYHCPITEILSNGETLTVVTTDLAGNTEISTTMVDVVDDDNDGISNVIEAVISDAGGDSNVQPDTDTDGDGLPDYAEIILGSDFLAVHSPVIDGNIDTDMDGISDAVEYFFDNTGGSIDSDSETDTDGDGIPDVTELTAIKSNFNQVNLPIVDGAGDDDGDNVTNAVEYYLSTYYGFNNIDDTSDYDHDGYSDALEVRLASDPLLANESDIDQDGVSDAIEAYLTGSINDGLDTSLLDRDNDGLPDILELTLSADLADPFSAINDALTGDIDGDGITDAIELYLSGDTTSVLANQDTDNDGITDIAEIAQGSNPLVNSTPVVWINSQDLGSGDVDLFAQLGGYQAPYPTFDWDVSAILNAEPSALIVDTSSQNLSVSGLSEGLYTVSLTISKTIAGQLLSSSTSQIFSVSELGVEDDDSDGIINAFDSSDGLMGAEERLTTTITADVPYDVQLQYGVGVRAGLIARMGNNQISTITSEQLANYINQDFPITAGDTSKNTNIAATPNMFDIDVVNIPSAGDMVNVVIPLNKPQTTSAAVLLFDHITLSWFYMDTSSTDSVSSAMGSPGSCPVPGDVSYTTGFVEGAYCLQLNITDGGPNDSDTSMNGAIPMLIGIGSSSHLIIPTETVSNEDIANIIGSSDSEDPLDTNNIETEIAADESGQGSEGGGSINPFTLLLLTLLSLYGVKNRRVRVSR